MRRSFLLALAFAALVYAPASAQIHSANKPQALLVAQSALNTSVGVDDVLLSGCQQTTVYVQWSSASVSGKVTVETADTTSYTGTWAPLYADAWVAGGIEDVIQITGLQATLRTRISTAIGGGTVSTWVTCN